MVGKPPDLCFCSADAVGGAWLANYQSNQPLHLGLCSTTPLTVLGKGPTWRMATYFCGEIQAHSQHNQPLYNRLLPGKSARTPFPLLNSKQLRPQEQSRSWIFSSRPQLCLCTMITCLMSIDIREPSHHRGPQLCHAMGAPSCWKGLQRCFGWSLPPALQHWGRRAAFSLGTSWHSYATVAGQLAGIPQWGTYNVSGVPLLGQILRMAKMTMCFAHQYW